MPDLPIVLVGSPTLKRCSVANLEERGMEVPPSQLEAASFEVAA